MALAAAARARVEVARVLAVAARGTGVEERVVAMAPPPVKAEVVKEAAAAGNTNAQL